ncbi:MAG: hypothetical protein AAB680_07330 [Pseudomonadota bacterium]
MKTAKQVQNDYTKGIILYALLYAAILFASIYAINKFNPNNFVKIFLALLTSLPIGGTILVFLNYIKNADEFIRAQVVEVFVKATGVTFFIATFWGFMENYTAISNIDFYMIYPIFWACFGLMQGIKKVRA